MSGEQDQDAKSEQPSDQKLRKAREKGDVPVSREVAHLLGFGALLALAWLATALGLGPAIQGLGSLFATAGQLRVGSGGAGLADLGPTVTQALLPLAALAAGALGVLLLGSILAGLLQGPFVAAAERIRPRANRLSPIRGLKRIIGLDHLVDFGKSLLKLAAIGAVGLSIVWSLIETLLPGVVVAPEGLAGLLQDHAIRLLGLVTLLMVPVAILDLVWKRLSHLRKQRMTLQELRDEYKESEGDPHVAAKRAQIRRQRSRQRLRQSVPTATLVVTNPTHFAVALRYERGVDPAPVCVAKGADRMAARIRQIAHESAVPVFESPALARALHATVELDQAIPEAHWQAVARLVSYVLDLRRRIRRNAPEGARLRRPEDDRA